MQRRRMRMALLSAAVVVGVGSVPSVAAAQLYSFSSCTTVGVCGAVNAFFAGTVLTVQLANHDNTLGSALYSAALFFSGPLASAFPGTAYDAPADATTIGAVTSIGTTSPAGWFYSGIGGSPELDLASAGNVSIEGAAASPFRANPGDADDGTWITSADDQWVVFQSDLDGLPGIDQPIVSLGFCTDQGCVTGAAVSTPEPATITLLATGLAGVAFMRRRRRAA